MDFWQKKIFLRYFVGNIFQKDNHKAMVPFKEQLTLKRGNFEKYFIFTDSVASGSGWCWKQPVAENISALWPGGLQAGNRLAGLFWFSILKTWSGRVNTVRFVPDWRWAGEFARVQGVGQQQGRPHPRRNAWLRSFQIFRFFGILEITFLCFYWMLLY